MNAVSVPTTASAITASCLLSWASTSETEKLKRDFLADLKWTLDAAEAQQKTEELKAQIKKDQEEREANVHGD